MSDLKEAGTAAEKTSLSGDYPSRLFVEVTTRCNLSCGMCVKQNGDSAISEGNMSLTTFDALKPAFPQLKAIILNGVGEPLLHPGLEDFVRAARKSMPEDSWTGFQTNGMLLTEARAESLLAAGLDRICLSMDAVSQGSFRVIRSGGEMSGLESAFSALKRARRKQGRKLLIGIEFVLRRDNLEELPAAMRWAAARGAAFVIVTQLLPYDEAFVKAAAYDTNTRGAISVYEDWKARAEASGVDMRRYPEIFMKFEKSVADLKIVDFVEQMKDDARSRGIALNIERMLGRNDDWFAKMDGIFEEARLAAEEAGIDLTLPATAPQNNRRCDFVEENSAFVSWDGKVSPCYFLWHRYHCHVGGWKKRVKPWTFGDLHEKDIVSIWNAREYELFRAGVLRYDFPFCVDCGFALCDYVETEDFEQDCYVNRVPCAACLWCTGLFRCLQ